MTVDVGIDDRYWGPAPVVAVGGDESEEEELATGLESDDGAAAGSDPDGEEVAELLALFADDEDHDAPDADRIRRGDS